MLRYKFQINYSATVSPTLCAIGPSNIFITACTSLLFFVNALEIKFLLLLLLLLLRL